MNTFEKFAHDYLFNNGMFEVDVQKVIEIAKQDVVLKDTMLDRWQDDIDGYPPFMKSIFLVSLNSVATKYIDEHQPNAWYREIFAGN